MVFKKLANTLGLTELFRKFVKVSESGGAILILCTVISLILANSSFGVGYRHFWQIIPGPEIKDFHLNQSIANWINDGLMTLFFLLMGLEIERELLIGELSNRRNAMLPVLAAIGGMVVPALLYFLINIHQPGNFKGAGIPTATDIAFAIAIMGFLGKRVPSALKIFLIALAIMDDLGAIVVIAVFYGQGIAWYYLALAGIVFGVLLLSKNRGISSLWVYVPLGFILWFCLLHSGIHATLAGVLLAFAIPFKKGDPTSPSYRLEKYLQIPVSWIVIPLFALANTAIEIRGNLLNQLFQPAILGIFFGLVIGKPLGIFITSRLAIKFKLARLPTGSTNSMLLGAGMLGGIGFTMAMFVTNLAFEDRELIETAKVCILIASITASLIGYGTLRFLKTKSE